MDEEDFEEYCTTQKSLTGIDCKQFTVYQLQANASSSIYLDDLDNQYEPVTDADDNDQYDLTTETIADAIDDESITEPLDKPLDKTTEMVITQEQDITSKSNRNILLRTYDRICSFFGFIANGFGI